MQKINARRWKRWLLWRTRNSVTYSLHRSFREVLMLSLELYQRNSLELERFLQKASHFQCRAMKLFNIDLKCQRNTAEFDTAKKLTELDCEVQKFVDKCRAKRVEDSEIATAISSAVKKARRKQRTQQWIKFAIGFLVVAVLTQNDISWRYFCRFGREAIFKVSFCFHNWQVVSRKFWYAKVR